MRRLWWLGAVALYAALALYQLYPAWWDPAHGVVGDWRHPDTISNHWLYRWVAEQLSNGDGILHNDRYYFSEGDAPWLAGNGSDAVPYTLLAALVPWPASVTLWVGLALVLNGLSGLVLARRLGASAAASTTAGAALALFPYVDAELAGGRFAQMPLYQVAFFLTVWHALLESAPATGPAWPGRATALRAALAAGLFGLASFSYWYHGLWAAGLGVTWFVFRPRWRALLPFVPLALVVTLPPLAIFLTHWSAIPGASETTFPHPIACQSALPPWFPLLGREGFWGPVILPILLVLPPVVALLPARLFPASSTSPLATIDWGHRAALVAALVFWALCLGPYPSWSGGADSGVAGPFLALYGLASPLRRFWWPYRHVVGLGIALVPLAAIGLDRLYALLVRFTEPRLRPWVPWAATLVIIALLPEDLASRKGVVAAPASRWSPPEAYVALAALPGDTVLELPLTPARVTGQQTLSYQWLHGKALINGHAMWVDRVRPFNWDNQVASVPLLHDFQALERGEAVSLRVDPVSESHLSRSGPRWIVVNDEYFPGTIAPLAKTYRTALDALFGPAKLDQDGVAAWDTWGRPLVGRIDVPAASLPAMADTSGGKVPDYGTLEPLGWATLTRDIPPRELEETER